MIARRDDRIVDRPLGDILGLANSLGASGLIGATGLAFQGLIAEPFGDDLVRVGCAANVEIVRSFELNGCGSGAGSGLAG